jgi:DNA-binding NarL/FixJ family response regulator
MRALVASAAAFGARARSAGTVGPEADGAAPPPLTEQRPEPPAEPLTPREVEVLRLVAQGKTNGQIAQELVVSKLTVKVHVQHIIRKLAVSDRTQAAVRAIELGLFAPEPG